MGVNGLWTVIQPCARPTNLATLNRKRLAVDASIWIYQFLKAVRDKEGNALRNSHVVGFFRRICKLLWFGIRPVFVFDGGAPALKRQTIANRKRRREGRREDAVRTAGKLLAVQMQRIAEDDERRRQSAKPQLEEPVEELPTDDKLVYVDELGMNQAERQKSRKFYRQDAYHLPELETSIEGMGKPEDPRIMSVEELEEYARQFHSGEDINLYDFSNIDFDGEFFCSLPPADRYNILNAARMRSRLRMGLSKEQLDEMFPDRMAFSKFQIERVQERNHLTQRLMKEAGMTGLDLTINGGGRIAGEKDREYILVKNDGVEGGWALGVVSREKDRGEMHKPIDVDALEFQYQAKDEEDEEDFEDVPIEGLNRLPKIPAQDAPEESLFVEDTNEADEEEDLNRAIALSLKNQHAPADNASAPEFEDVPEWTQKAVDQPKPVTSASGSMIAHIVNNRANAAMPRRRSDASDDSDVDLRSALSKAKRKPRPNPAVSKKNSDGPLPFAKLDWRSSIFARKADKPELAEGLKEPERPEQPERPEGPGGNSVEDNDTAGGFVVDQEKGDTAGGFLTEDQEEEGPRPLPPWMVLDESDIRDAVKEQRERDREIHERDRQDLLEQQRRLRADATIEIGSDESDGSDVEMVDAPVRPANEESIASNKSARLPSQPVEVSRTNQSPSQPVEVPQRTDESPEPTFEDIPTTALAQATESPEPIFEDIPGNASTAEPSFEGPVNASTEPTFENPVDASTEPTFDPVNASTEPTAEDLNASTELPADLNAPADNASADNASADLDAMLFGDENGQTVDDDLSDPEDEELFAQLAEEAEEHARFASQLNNKSERENQEAYEQELKALRSQQKKDRRDADEVTQIMVNECQALLRLFGIPYITAPMEAEAQCAELVHLGLVDGIVTDDSDTFLFGGTRVYKNMFNSNKFVECYLGSDLEKELSLTRDQLISIAQLLGSDYTEGLPGVGPVTAVEIISEFPGRQGLQAFRDWWEDVQIRGRPKEADAGSTFRKKFRKSQAQKLFLPVGFPNPTVFEAYLKPEVDAAAEPFQWGVPDVDGLRRFLMATIGWSQERTDEVLVPVIRDMNRRETEGTQSNITRFFEGSVGAGARGEAFAPRQRVLPSKRMAGAISRLRANVGGGDVEEEAAVAEPVQKRKRADEETVSGRKRRGR